MVLLDASWQIRGTEAKKRQASRPQHARETIEDLGVLFSRDVNDSIVGAHSVEGFVSERQRGEVCTNPESCGHMISGESELGLGKVDSDDAGMSDEPLGDWDSSPATRIKHTCPLRQAENEIIQQRNVRRIATA